MFLILPGRFTTASGLLSQIGSNASFSVLLTAILRGRFTTASGLHVCYCVDGDSTASGLHKWVYRRNVLMHFTDRLIRGLQFHG